MTGDDEQYSKDDQEKVVDQLLSDLGVDDAMRKELVESGRASSDLLKVASSEQVRRRMEIEKSTERLRDSLNLLERNVTQIENSIDRIERDLIPVILSFLVSLKGSLVNIRNTVIDESKRQAKTHLQATYADTTVRKLVEEKFAPIEESLSSEMSAPIMDKVREIVDGFKAFLNVTMDEMTNLKLIFEDYTQRTGTEIEFLTKEVSMKPKVEVPKEVQQEIEELKRTIEQLQHELDLTMQKVENRDAEIIALQTNLAATKLRNESLEESLEELRLSPTVDSGALVELRQKITVMEAEEDLLRKQLEEAKEVSNQKDEVIAELKARLTMKELAIQDFKQKITALEAELDNVSSKLGEIDELRAQIRTLESGEPMRELERMKAEVARLSAANQRLTNDHNEMKKQKEYAEARIQGYLGLMNSAEKTKAFLILEDNGEITLRELARSLGVSPAIISQWSDDFERLGLAKKVDDRLVLAIGSKEAD